MIRVWFAIALSVFALSFTPQAAEKEPLKLAATIPLPGLQDGDFDHFAADVAGHRLFLAAEENGKVLVFDTNTNKLIATIGELKAPHSIIYRGDLKRLFIVDGDDSAVKIYDGDTYKLTGKIVVAIDADSIAYDPDSKYMYVVNGGRAAHEAFSIISVVDTSTMQKLRDIKIDSNQIEAIVLEKSGRRLFCNITGKNAVGVIDRSNGSLLATWPLPPTFKHNVSLAMDEANHRLFVVTRDPGTLVVLNSDDGTFITSVPAVSMVDDMAYDPTQKRIYVAGDQFIDIFEQEDADNYALLARIPGAFRAKTATLLPESRLYYLAVPRHGSKEAEVRVYNVQP